MIPLLWLGSAHAEMVNGIQLPENAQKVGENRYRTSLNWEDILKYYRTVYSPQAFPRRTIVNQPGVRAIHIVNTSSKLVEGLNVYEANEEVRIYIVPKEVVHKKPARSGKKKK